MRRNLSVFWLAGFLAGAILYCYWHLQNSGKLGSSDPNTLLVLQNFTLLFWPSSLMLMSLSGEHPASTIIIVAISLCSNGFVYVGVGYFVLKFFGSNSRSSNSPRQE
jgi:putative effector of murein hydrolase LrgA (UPF0299 family)